MTKLAFSLLVAAALIVPLGIAQTPPDIAADAKKANVPDPVIAPFCVGTAFNATLVTPLDASRNKAGDSVTAETSEAVTYERTVIFPKGTKIYGHLVRASSSRSGKGLRTVCPVRQSDFEKWPAGNDECRHTSAGRRASTGVW